ncbi:MAG: sialate O-acetylesterase [Bacteroidales bacterium]
MKKLLNIVLSFLLLTLITSPAGLANVTLPGIFTDNMVLQQNSDIIVWGWAKTGEKVTVAPGWNVEPVSVVVDNQGKWRTSIHTPAAGGPYTLTISGWNRIELKNVLIGEVWLCSGQSNMEWSAQSGIVGGEQEIKEADNPMIRLFTVNHGTSDFPQDHLSGQWVQCTPETMKSFSAIGYFFARKISRELKVPVGIINSSWGGTPAESWTPGKVYNTDTFLREAAAKQKPVPWGPVEPGRIYNFMISPLVPFRIAGVLWYQGEANTINSYAYKEILTSMITSWRGLWQYNFPFYYAQIAPYKYGRPSEGAEVRDAQRRALSLDNTGMIILSDIGDTNDIHPRRKLDAALRFANMALNRHYNLIKSEDSGPLYKSFTIENDKMIIAFSNADGLNSTGGKPTCFEIAGEDNVFYKADAKIKDQTVILQSKNVKKPIIARFAWSNTSTPNLFNSAGLPASTFTTR